MSNLPEKKPYTHKKKDHLPLKEYLSKLHNDRIKLKNHYASLFDNTDYDRIASTLRDCHQTRVLACCRACHGAWYVLHKCRQRVCPICSAKVFRTRAEFLRRAAAQCKHPKLITLTQPLVENHPREAITKIRDAFAKLRKTECWKSVTAGAYTIEVIPKPEGWHIHMHVLVNSEYIPYQKLWSTWGELIGHKVIQTDIRAADNKNAQQYLAKYCAKSVSMYLGDKTIVDWYRATKGQRLFVTFGSWYNKHLEEIDPQFVPFIPHCLCPHCKTEKTTFLARDGPMIFGHEFWNAAATEFTGGFPERLAEGIPDPLQSPT